MFYKIKTYYAPPPKYLTLLNHMHFIAPPLSTNDFSVIFPWTPMLTLRAKVRGCAAEGRRWKRNLPGRYIHT